MKKLMDTLTFVSKLFLKSFYDRKNIDFLTTFNIYKSDIKFFFLNDLLTNTLKRHFIRFEISLASLLSNYPLYPFMGTSLWRIFTLENERETWRGVSLHNFLIPSVLLTSIYLCCFIFTLLLTCNLTYKNHHTPILTNNNKPKVENQIVMMRFNFFLNIKKNLWKFEKAFKKLIIFSKNISKIIY